jgi:hypothetical protein
VITVRGTPRVMGEAIGQAFRTELAGLAILVTERLMRINPALDRHVLHDLMRAAKPAFQAFDPSLWMELEGMARSSGLVVEDLMLAHGFSDLLSHFGSRTPPFSSTFLAFGPARVRDQHPLQVLGWAPDPFIIDRLAVIRRQPSNGPRTASLTIAGVHPVAGVSEARLAGVWNELRVNDGRPGLMTAHMLASALNVPDYATAAKRLEAGPRFGGGALHLLAGDGRRLSLEISGQRTAKLDDPDPAMLRIHTNHPIADSIVSAVAVIDATSSERLGQLARRAQAESSISLSTVSSWFGHELDESSAEYEPDEFLPHVVPEAGVLVVLDPQGRRLWARTCAGGTGEVGLG